jgi:hypothetical protein
LASTDHPITTPPGLGRVGLDQPQPNLFLHPGRWQATRPTCGSVLVQGWRQDRVEATAARTSCPVWVEVAA